MQFFLAYGETPLTNVVATGESRAIKMELININPHKKVSIPGHTFSEIQLLLAAIEAQKWHHDVRHLLRAKLREQDLLEIDALERMFTVDGMTRTKGKLIDEDEKLGP